MDTPDSVRNEDGIFKVVVDVGIRLALLALLVVWCFLIFRPFVLVVMWAAIIAVVFYPAFGKLRAACGGRKGLAGAVFILVGLAILIVPSIFLTDSLIQGTRNLTAAVESEEIEVPPPSESVKTWPVIGPGLYDTWYQASVNLDTTLEKFKPQLKNFGQALVALLASVGQGLIFSILAVLIAGILMMQAEGGERVSRMIMSRLGGPRGEAIVDLTSSTIRTVVKGVLATAAIQALAAGLGLYLAGVPAAGLWTVLVLVVAVMQLPPILILGPAAIYLFAFTDNTVVAVIFTIWSLIVSGSDGILKPILLGRGSSVPMPVILIGAIGGMMLSGVIGLFLGAVVFAIGYNLFMAWVRGDDEDTAAAGEAKEGTAAG